MIFCQQTGILIDLINRATTIDFQFFIDRDLTFFAVKIAACQAEEDGKLF
jgi:hypothetical protein